MKIKLQSTSGKLSCWFIAMSTKWNQLFDTLNVTWCHFICLCQILWCHKKAHHYLSSHSHCESIFPIHFCHFPNVIFPIRQNLPVCRWQFTGNKFREFAQIHHRTYNRTCNYVLKCYVWTCLTMSVHDIGPYNMNFTCFPVGYPFKWSNWFMNGQNGHLGSTLI